MPAVRRPKKGSKGFYPKKRAKRIYPRIKSWPDLKSFAILGFAGYKAGMSHVILTESNPRKRTKGQPVSTPVTVIECPPVSVLGFRCYQSTPQGLKSVYDVFSEKPDKNVSRKVNIKSKSVPDQLKNLEQKKFSKIHLLCNTRPPFKKTPEIFEIAMSGDITKQTEYAKQILGKEIKVSDIFKQGDYIDVSSVTKGKGFTGPVKRFGIKIHGRKARKMHRHVGTLGPRHPSRIQSTVPMAGQLGFQTRTELNKRIIKIDSGFKIKGGFPYYGDVKNEYILLEGSVPGPKKRLVRLRVPIRPPKIKYPVEIKYVSIESKQGV